MPGRKKTTATKSAAKRKTVARKPRRKTTRRPKVAGKFGSRHYAIEVRAGELVGVGPDDKEWGPVACGVHRSAAVHETATDDEDEKAPGFDPGCEDCVAQAESTGNYAITHHTV
jgi:hypothetical protein